MISETFAKGFEKEMNSRFKGDTVVESEDYSIMWGMIEGAWVCGHMNRDDKELIRCGFGRVTCMDGDLNDYIKVVKDLSKKQHED